MGLVAEGLLRVFCSDPAQERRLRLLGRDLPRARGSAEEIARGKQPLAALEILVGQGAGDRRGVDLSCSARSRRRRGRGASARSQK